MADAKGARVISFPDLPPKGSPGPRGKQALLGPEIGTEFDYGQRLFAYYGSGDVFDYGSWDARDMRTMLSRDGVCAALEHVLTLPIREADFSIEKGAGDNGEAEFARSVIMTPDVEGGMATPVQELIGQVCTAQIYRRAFFEKVWVPRESDGKIIYRKIAYRPTATCQARYNDRTSEPNGFRQQVWLFGGNLMISSKQKVPGYVDIPKMRSYIYTHGKNREPLTGVSEMDTAYWVYQTKLKLLFLWMNFLESQSMPRLIVYGNDQPEATRNADDISQLKASGIVGLPHPIQGQKMFEQIQSPDAGTFFQECLSFLENWQIMSVLAGFLGLTGMATAGRGSYALSQDQSDFFLKSRQAVAKEIAESLSYDVVRPLVMLNFGANAAFPVAKFGPLQDEQVQLLMTLYGQIAAAPALHLPIQVVDLLTERMASVLQLDVDQVHKALKETIAQRSEQMAANPPPGVPPDVAGSLGGLQGMAQAGSNLVQQAQARGNINVPPPPAGPPSPPPVPSPARFGS